MKAHPTPELVFFDDSGSVPNNPVLPVYLVRDALPGRSAGDILAHFEAMGWRGTWTSVVFDFQHYHHDAHEALCVATGWADIQLGGPDGQVFRLESGDLVVLPAGTGHCRIARSADFAICGCYPPGQEDYTLDRATADARARHGDAIRAVPLPLTDPVFGADGPLVKAWGG